MKILIVEDEQDIAELITYNLRREGYLVECALSGEKGLSKARAELPDLIILDIMLPEMNGLDVVTDEGTVIMPCFNSAEQVVKDMKSGKQLDLRDMKSATGIITETFRTQSGVCRSSHPFSSVCAWGKQAEYIVSGHATHEHVCHENSPVGRLVELNGKVVGIGIPIAQGLGVAHYLEDTWDKFPFNVHTSPFEVSYIDNEGNPVKRLVSRYDPYVSRTRIDYPEGAWIGEKLTNHLTNKGILKRFTFGDVDSWIMEAVPLYNELKRLAEKGVTMYLTEDRLTDQNRDVSNW